MEAARLQRDKRLRRKLLMVLYHVARSAPTRQISGRVLVDQTNGLMPPAQQFEDDTHALQLLRDLVNAGLATEAPLGQRRRGQAFGLDWCQYGITDRGTALHEGHADPHPLVDDDRQLDG